MGSDVAEGQLDVHDHDRFRDRLRACLRALDALLARPGFGDGELSIGAELELNLVDAESSRPALINHEVLETAGDPRVALELNRFNIELNSTPAALAGAPFSALGAELRSLLDLTNGSARAHGGRVLPIGILPTLRADDLLGDNMTDRERYRQLSAELRRLRGAPFHIHINGLDPIDLDCDDVTLEGAATSLQIHLRVAPSDYAAVYNAVQIATAPVLAVASNSPFFLGHRLWDETRIALFKQAVDDRAERSAAGWPPPRVAFGHGWVRDGIHELFEESAALHQPLMPFVCDEDPEQCLAGGGVPALHELRLHNGTVWRWNRAIYDAADGGHLRIEMRSLPAGPTVRDMMANAALHVGLALGLARHAAEMTARLPFAYAQHNFYRAAQTGIDAELLWPSPEPPSPRPERATDLVLRLLPIARRGLVDAGVSDSEADEQLEVIEQRCRTARTGARWQRAAFDALSRGAAPAEALAAMVEHYADNVEGGQPVHSWSIPS